MFAAGHWLAAAAIVAVSVLPAVAGCATKDSAEIRLLTLSPSAPLALGQAYGLVVEIGDIGMGNVLSVFDRHGNLIGSIAPTFGLPVPQSARVGLIRTLDGQDLQVEVRVHPRDDPEGRPPTDDELLGIELVPIGITGETGQPGGDTP